MLEDRLARFFETEHVLTTNNGTHALYSARFAIGEGDDPRTALRGVDVLCPTYAWWSAAAPILQFGGRPVFCDVTDSLQIDVANARKQITPQTEVLILPFMWGVPPDIPAVCELAAEHDLSVVTDTSHAWGAKFDGQPVGTLFSAAGFSMQAGKPLPAGEGGVAVFESAEQHQRAMALGQYRRLNQSTTFGRYRNTGLGYKFRISPLNAAVALAQFPAFEDRIERERQYRCQFFNRLSDISGIVPIRDQHPAYRHGGSFQYRLKLTLDAPKSDVLSALTSAGVPAEDEYVPLLHTEPAFEQALSDGVGSSAERLHSNLIGFPAFRRGTSDDINAYVEAIETVLHSRDW
jgi:dTDP-4-amino-4,6-dideoxygalactose transaminase